MTEDFLRTYSIIHPYFVLVQGVLSIYLVSSLILNVLCLLEPPYAAVPENYLRKSSTFGSKSGTSIPGQIRKNCYRAFKGLSYLAYKLSLVKYFIHIIELSFSVV